MSVGWPWTAWSTVGHEPGAKRVDGQHLEPRGEDPLPKNVTDLIMADHQSDDAEAFGRRESMEPPRPRCSFEVEVAFSLPCKRLSELTAAGGRGGSVRPLLFTFLP